MLAYALISSKAPGVETKTTTLYRPVGEDELEKIRQINWLGFPPRLPEQPIFYPVLNEEYAKQIARDWNARDGRKGYVLRFEIEAEFIAKYEIHTVGSRIHQEYWIPAEELNEFNQHIIGRIEIASEFRPE
jgi:hypothetical protein